MMFPLPARAIRPTIALLLFAIGFPYSAARTWHVSGSGNDTHAGTSAAAAFRTLQKAAELLANDREETRRAHRTPLPGQAEYLDLVRAVLELAPGQPDRQRQTLDTIAGFALRKHAGGAS